jgi:hypothetical protein
MRGHTHFVRRSRGRKREFMVSSTTATVIGATVIGAGIGVGAAAMSGAFDGPKKTDSAPAGVDPSTGALSEAEAQSAAKKRLFRSGVMFTGTSGLGSGETLGQGRLK